MRNLLLFIIRYHAFFLFLLLEIICFSLVVQNKKQEMIFMHSSNLLVGQVYDYYNNILRYWDLSSANERLKMENAKLRGLLRYSHFAGDTSQTTINDTSYQQRYRYIPVSVINNSVNRDNNYLTIDRGRKHGIQVNTGVFVDNGIVGIVREVSDNYAAVMSILHKDIHISAGLASSNYHGSLVWLDRNRPRIMTLEAVPKHAIVAKGEAVLTTGYSKLFPQGIQIGTVDSMWVDKGSNFYTIEVLLSADLNNIRYVYVIEHLMKDEQVKLEQKILDER